MRTADVIEFGGGMNYGAATNASNVLTATIADEVLTSYSDGLVIQIKPDVTTDGAVTLNVNSIGAKNVYLESNQTTQATTQLVANSLYTLGYNSSLNTAAGGWVLKGF